MIRAASIVAASLCTINRFVKHCPEIVKKYISIWGVGSYLKLGGQVVMQSASAAALQYYSAKNLAGWAIAQSAHPSFMPVSFVVPGGHEAGLSDTNLLLYLWTISKNTRQSVWHRYLNNRNFSQSY